MKALSIEQLSRRELAAVIERLEYYGVNTEFSIYGNGASKYLVWRKDGGVEYVYLFSSLGTSPHSSSIADPVYFKVSYMPEDLLGKGLIPYIGLPA